MTTTTTATTQRGLDSVRSKTELTVHRKAGVTARDGRRLLSGLGLFWPPRAGDVLLDFTRGFRVAFRLVRTKDSGKYGFTAAARIGFSFPQT